MHSRDRETPLPLYVALKIHAVTRRRGLIDILFHLGMCVSYDRVLQVTSEMANGICQRFRMEEAVCPPKLMHRPLHNRSNQQEFFSWHCNLPHTAPIR